MDPKRLKKMVLVAAVGVVGSIAGRVSVPRADSPVLVRTADGGVRCELPDAGQIVLVQ